MRSPTSGATDPGEPDLDTKPRKAQPRAALFRMPQEPITIDRYTLLASLGHGGMGAVYAAHDPQLDRKVAIKLLRTRGSVRARKRLEREAWALARLSHPNVVQVHDIGVH